MGKDRIPLSTGQKVQFGLVAAAFAALTAGGFWAQKGLVAYEAAEPVQREARIASIQKIFAETLRRDYALQEQQTRIMPAKEIEGRLAAHETPIPIVTNAAPLTPDYDALEAQARQKAEASHDDRIFKAGTLPYEFASNVGSISAVIYSGILVLMYNTATRKKKDDEASPGDAAPQPVPL